MWSVPADGSGSEELFFALPGHAFREVTFSPDGKYAILRANTGQQVRQAELWLLPLYGDRKAVPFGTTPFSAAVAAVSPISQWVAYESNATGRIETYLRAIEGRRGVLQVSSGGGSEPRWLPDGRLVYRASSAFRAVTLSEPDGAVTVVRRDSLFADSYLPNGDRPSYDISHDGSLCGRP